MRAFFKQCCFKFIQPKHHPLTLRQPKTTAVLYLLALTQLGGVKWLTHTVFDKEGVSF